MVVAGLLAYGGYRAANRPSRPNEASLFARQVQLGPLHRTAVQADGRLRSFESHAKTYIGLVTGSRSIRGQSNGFTYLDLMFRPEAYTETDLIYVKNKEVRAQMLDALKGFPDMNPARRNEILDSGLFPRRLLSQPQVMVLLQKLGQDLIRTSKAVDAINMALGVSDSRFLLDTLRFIPPPGGNVDAPWRPMADLVAARNTPQDDVHAGLTMPALGVPGLDSELQKKLAETWTKLQTAWRAQEAPAVNEQVAMLAGLLPTVASKLYPSEGRLAMESWYFRYQSMTWVWLLYLAAVMPLLMSIIYKWDRARTIGMVLFVIAFAAHTTSVAIRWYISGRWPNSNMFEAVTTSAWFGGVAAMILERLTRRTPFRNLFALGSAVISMAALMAAYYLPAQLDSAINNKMAALNDVWLYIHTNVIIWSYAVIGLACIPALLQLRQRWCLAWDRGAAPKVRLLILPLAAGILNYTGYLLLMNSIDKTGFGLSGRSAIGVLGAFFGSLMIVIMEALGARARAKAGGATERSASGGASSLILGSASGASFLREEKPSASQIFDGATMVLVELSFIMLWTGLVMGAIWADHSWGRPWGWDPKEVFALNTFLIFLILIHVRLKVRDKAFWTAILAVVGFEVMMFNWIVVNFVISGLHSYA